MTKRTFTIKYKKGNVGTDFLMIGKNLYGLSDISDSLFVELLEIKLKKDIHIFDYVDKYGLDFYQSGRYHIYKENPPHNTSLEFFNLVYGEALGVHKFREYYENRFNPYDINQVQNKYSLTREEAEERVLLLKKKTSTNMDMFIAKYGEEEGIERYKNKCKKDSYRNTLEGKIDLYGEEEGMRRYLTQNKNNSYFSSLNGYKERFGEEEGCAIWNNINHKRKFACCNLHLKYGEEELLYINESRRITKEKLVERYGKEKAEDIVARRTNYFMNMLEYLQNKFGMDIQEAELYKYTNHANINRKIPFDNQEEMLNRIEFIKLQKVQTKKQASLESLSLFLPLLEYISEQYQFEEVKLGYGGKEKVLYEEDGKRLYRYDFCIEDIKIIIEYDGENFHPYRKSTKEELEAWKHPFSNLSYLHYIEMEDKKDLCAINNGYGIIRIHYKDNNKIQIAKEYIDEAYKKYRNQQ